MSTPVLTYFDFAGSRGEEARIALELAGIDWVDDRFNGEWQAKKPTTPFGALPILEIPGKGTLSQSNAILGYIGREYGLLPTDAFEAARHDAIMSAVEELRYEGARTANDDPQARRTAREAFAAGYLTRWATNLSAQIRAPFIGGDEISVADVKVYVALRAFRRGVYDDIPATFFDAYPIIIAQMDAVAAHPRVAAWDVRFAR